MDDQRFWALIAEARAAGGDPADPATPSADAGALSAVLAPLSNDEVTAFSARYYEILIRLNQWPIWGVGYVMAGGMSDDSFHYFRSWIIGKGQAAFEVAMADPEGLAAFVGPKDSEIDNELLEYVPIEMLEARGIDGDPRDDVDGDADGEPDGEPFDEDGVFDQYPKLAAQFA